MGPYARNVAQVENRRLQRAFAENWTLPLDWKHIGAKNSQYPRNIMLTWNHSSKCCRNVNPCEMITLDASTLQCTTSSWSARHCTNTFSTLLERPSDSKIGESWKQWNHLATKRNLYSIPRVDELIDLLDKTIVFSTLDRNSTFLFFWQI